MLGQVYNDLSSYFIIAGYSVQVNSLFCLDPWNLPYFFRKHQNILKQWTFIGVFRNILQVLFKKIIDTL